MINNRLAALLIFLGCVMFPFAFMWSIDENGHWLRIFWVWTGLVFSTYLIQRRGFKDEW